MINIKCQDLFSSSDFFFFFKSLSKFTVVIGTSRIKYGFSVIYSPQAKASAVSLTNHTFTGQA